jgi:hypothetical protein
MLSGFTVTPGLTYTLTFDAWANTNVCITAKFGEALPPYAAYATQMDCLTTIKSPYKLQFTAVAGDTIPGGIVFLFTLPVTDTVCITDVVVTAQ